MSGLNHQINFDSIQATAVEELIGIVQSHYFGLAAIEQAGTWLIVEEFIVIEQLAVVAIKA